MIQKYVLSVGLFITFVGPIIPFALCSTKHTKHIASLYVKILVCWAITKRKVICSDVSEKRAVSIFTAIECGSFFKGCHSVVLFITESR